MVRTGRLCPWCGSDGHGRPWARHAERPVPVSVSRCDDLLLTAVGDETAVGVDVESVSALALRWDPGLVLAPGEVAHDDRERTRTWVRKEAVLKAYGVGLALPMTGLNLAGFDGRVGEPSAPEGYVAAWAALSAGPAAPAGTARRRRGR